MSKIEYKVVNGTSYRAETNDKVVRILENARQNKQRIRVFFGDTESGKCWLEEYDTMGMIGRSGGEIKIPLLIKSKSSFGGVGIRDHHIIKITIDKKTVYQHEKFHIGEFSFKQSNTEGYTTSVLLDGHCVARFKSEAQAGRWVAFMKGERNSK